MGVTKLLPPAVGADEAPDFVLWLSVFAGDCFGRPFQVEALALLAPARLFSSKLRPRTCSKWVNTVSVRCIFSPRTFMVFENFDLNEISQLRSWSFAACSSCVRFWRFLELARSIVPRRRDAN